MSLTAAARAEFRALVGTADASPSPEQLLARNYLWCLISRHGPFHDGFDPDPMEMARLAGEKRIGMQVFTDFLEGAPDVLYRLMTAPPVPLFQREEDDDG